MDATSGTRLRRGLFGYRRRDVEAELSALRERLAAAEESPDIGASLGRHLGRLLTRFAETVEVGEREAHDRAAAIVADAEARAAAILADAARQRDAASAARQAARTPVEAAIEQLGRTLAMLDAAPDAVADAVQPPRDDVTLVA